MNIKLLCLYIKPNFPPWTTYSFLLYGAWFKIITSEFKALEDITFCYCWHVGL